MRHVSSAVKGVALVTGITAAIGFVLAANAPPGPYTRPTPPPPVGAFAAGGTPAHDAAIETALAQLPATVPGRGDAALARLPAWGGLVDALARFPETSVSDHRLPEWSRELAARAATVSDELAAAGIGYFVDVRISADDGVARPRLYAYRIDDVSFVRGADRRVRVLGARRLDLTAPSGAAASARPPVARLGYTTEELDDPIVLLDQVDAKVAEQIMPVLAGSSFPIGDDVWSHSPRGRAITMKAGAAIRRELRFALGTDLADPTPRCQRLVAESVRHHEAQHGLDRDRELQIPGDVRTYIRDDGPLARQTSHEISGYLSQIASDAWLPQLVLWNLARHAFGHHDRPIAETFAAVVIIEQLAHHFDLPAPIPGILMARGMVDRDRLAAVIAPLADVPTLELRAAAAAVWTELFGGKLPRLVDELPAD